MNAAVIQMRDIVTVHITAELPIRARALSFADRVEVRFGKAFPVVLIVDRAALDPLGEALGAGRTELDATANRKTEG